MVKKYCVFEKQDSDDYVGIYNDVSGARIHALRIGGVIFECVVRKHQMIECEV